MYVFYRIQLSISVYLFTLISHVIPLERKVHSSLPARKERRESMEGREEGRERGKEEGQGRRRKTGNELLPAGRAHL